GKAYIHLFTLARPDEADYTVRVKFAPTATKPPAPVATLDDIANPPDLPAVPTADPHKPTGGHRDVIKPPPPPPTAKGLKGRITDCSQNGDKVHIIINKGQGDEVDVGWKGAIYDKDGHKVPKSEFQIYKASANEAHANVAVGLDVVQQSRDVLLQKPAE